jgi:SulP family sulfate permease
VNLYPPLRQQWFGNIRGDVLAGLVVALALIPEAIAFSIIAGVDPKVGLYASFCICVVIAFVGGRPGMISAATGAMALLMVGLVKDHGLQYLLVATLLTGVLQILAGLLKLGALMRFVSRSVITGFVNALAILIFMAQLPELIGVPALVYPLVALGLLVIYGLPWLSQRTFAGLGLWLLVLGAALTAGSLDARALYAVAAIGAAALLLCHRWTRTLALPPPLVAIVLLTGMALYFGIAVPTVGDKGQLPNSLPTFLLPDVPWTLETLKIVFPVSATLAVVGLLESMMTAQIVDDMTDTPSGKNRECIGQGAANIASGLIGGMAGCAMIGQSVINVQSGGRGRLSALVAGCALLMLVVFAGAWVRQIPMAALVAVMIMVSIGTFSWRSLAQLRGDARHGGGDRGHPRPGARRADRRAAVGAVLRAQGRAHAGHRQDRGRRGRPCLPHQRPAVLRLGRQLRRRVRLCARTGAGHPRPDAGASVGRQRHRRTGQGGAEVPPPWRTGAGAGTERRQRRHGRGPGHAPSCRRRSGTVALS